MAYHSRVRSDPAPPPPTRPERLPLVMPPLRGWYAGWADPAVPRAHYNRLRAAAKGLALAGWGWRGAAAWDQDLAFEEGSYGFHQSRVRSRDRNALEASGVWARAESRVRATDISWPRRRDAQAHLVRQALALLGSNLDSPVGWWMGWLQPESPSAALVRALDIRVIVPEADEAQLDSWAAWSARLATPPSGAGG